MLVFLNIYVVNIRALIHNYKPFYCVFSLRNKNKIVDVKQKFSLSSHYSTVVIYLQVKCADFIR